MLLLTSRLTKAGFALTPESTALRCGARATASRSRSRCPSTYPPPPSPTNLPSSSPFISPTSPSSQVRLPKIKRWHARLRRRLKRGSVAIDPVYGRWLPRNRLSHDQVGCNLRAGLQNTYEEKGSKRVWIAGAKADDGKRFCTFNITTRAICIAGKQRRGQPRMGVTFRGLGKKISAQERAAWHPDVHVRFQKKAWADDALCEEVAGEEIAEATADARSAGERSVVFYDNLSGQTTPEHLRTLKRQAKADRHLLPTNTTSELMHIDDGVGAAFKNRLGEEMDGHLEGEGNLERWVAGPKEGGLKAWEKRVLVTNLAARAWERLCETYDFEASALRLGLLMTIDGSNDNKIKPQGLGEAYTFSDADGGEAGNESDIDEEELVDIAEVEEGEEEALEEEDEEEAEDGMEESDEEDDTADQLWACGDAPDVPPPGYTYAQCPPLETEEQQRALVGRRVLVAHNSDPIGWHIGRVRFLGVSAADKKACPTANFKLRFTKKETNSEMKEGQEEARELTASNYGRDEWWLLLDPVPSAE